MHYKIFTLDSLEDLKKIFPEPVADERNVCLFSTSGVHGWYGTIEDCETGEFIGSEVTVLVIHPRTVTLRYGNVEVTKESAPYLKALRESSWQVLQQIGRHEK